jgi:hypothetical protein
MGSGALIQAAGSNYSVDLSAGTEAIMAIIQYCPKGGALGISDDTE